jgi:transposase
MKLDTEGNAKREAGGRRRFSKEFKRQVVEETLAGSTSVAGIALRHRLNANLVFTWRRRYLRALAATRTKSVRMLPVTVADAGAAVPMIASELVSAGAGKSPRRSPPRGAIEIELNGARIQLKGAVDAEALRVVLTVLASR